ncbi:MAG: conjugal transfer protein TraH [Campylobacterales bacterium]|nr:conjugal transfer protein TraH [Campylobacterales bacterium]
MKNKIISSLLVFTIIGTDVAKASDSFWDDHTFTNFTPAGSATDPNTGTKYYSGGSYHVKFRSLTEFQPWVQVGAPELKVGCRGVDLNLGFGSLINFEQLSKQLQEAGASIAWGVLIGLAYSLPALKQVFDTIQEWAARIQHMLANACNFGKVIGQHIADKSGLKANLGDRVEGWMGKIDSTMKEFIGGPIESADMWMSNVIKEGKSTNEDNKKLTSGQLVMHISNKAGGMTSSFLTSLVRNGQETGVNFELAGGSADVMIKDIPIEESGLSNSSIIAVYFLLALTNDEALSDESLGVAISLAGATKEQNRELIADMVKLLEEISTTATEKMTTETTTLTSLMDFFLQGSNSGLIDEMKKMPQPKVVLMSQKSKNGKLDNYILLGENSDKQRGSAFKNWKGLIRESAEIIASIVNTTAKQIGAQGKVEYSNTNMPLLMPEKYDDIKNIMVALRLKSTASVDENGLIKFNGNKNFEILINQMARQNALLGAELMLENIEKLIRENTKKEANKTLEGNGIDGVKTHSASSKALESNKKHFEARLNQLKYTLNKNKQESVEAMKNIIDSINIDLEKTRLIKKGLK